MILGGAILAVLSMPTAGLNACAFGSAKMLVQGEPNIAYICSRYYRAPELIFGATDYTPAIGELNVDWHT